MPYHASPFLVFVDFFCLTWHPFFSVHCVLIGCWLWSLVQRREGLNERRVWKCSCVSDKRVERV